MANEPDVPAQLYQALNERLQDNDKEAAIELYYELLSSGYSVGEILNGIGPGSRANPDRARGQRRNSRYQDPTRQPPALPPRSRSRRASRRGRHGSGAWAEPTKRKVAGAENRRQSEARRPMRSGRTTGNGSVHEDWPGSESSVTGAAGADASRGWDAATGSGDQERPRFGGLSSFPRRIAFAAFYAAAVACRFDCRFFTPAAAAIPNRRLPAFSPISPTEQKRRRCRVRRRIAPRRMRTRTMPKTQAVSTGAAPAPKPSQPGEPDLATSRPLEPISVGVRATVSASRREAETPPQPNAGQPDAIEQLIEQSTDPAEAPRGSADGPDPSVAQSPSVTPAGPPETGQPETGEKPQAAPTDEAKATPSGPTETTPAASPSKAPVVEKRRESSARRNGSRQSVERRTAARRPQPVDGGQAPVSNATAQGAGPYYIDPARGYGYGAFGPSPYSDRRGRSSRPGRHCRRSGQAAGPRPGIRCRRCIRSSGCGRSPERPIRSLPAPRPASKNRRQTSSRLFHTPRGARVSIPTV